MSDMDFETVQDLWFGSAGGERVRPYLINTEIQRPLFDGMDWKVTFRAVFGTRTVQVDGRGRTYLDAEADGLLRLEQKYQKFLAAQIAGEVFYW